MRALLLTQIILLSEGHRVADEKVTQRVEERRDEEGE